MAPTLAVKIPAGGVMAPELSKIAVCPRELDVVRIPNMVDEPEIVSKEPGVIEEECERNEEDPAGTLLLVVEG